MGGSDEGGLVTLGETMTLFGSTSPGSTHQARHFRLAIAGSESNVAIGARRLGLRAAWFGRVGTDQLGDLILRELRAEDVHAHAVRDPAPTGMMLKLQRTSELSEILYYRRESAGSRLSVEDLDEDVIRQARVLHLTGITPALGPSPAATVWAAIEVATHAGVPISFDVNYRSTLWSADQAAPILTSLIKKADIVFAGQQEAGLVTSCADVEESMYQLAHLGPREVIVKRGARGAVALSGERRYEQPAVEVATVDPVGAGDAFVAGYLADFALNRAVEQRLRTAAATAAFVVASRGDWEGLPTRRELELATAVDTVVR